MTMTTLALTMNLAGDRLSSAKPQRTSRSVAAAFSSHTPLSHFSRHHQQQLQTLHSQRTHYHTCPIEQQYTSTACCKSQHPDDSMVRTHMLADTECIHMCWCWLSAKIERHTGSSCGLYRFVTHHTHLCFQARMYNESQLALHSRL